MPNREGRRRSQCPFTFANKSNGIDGWGINPVKIYNAQGKEIVQALNGTNDTNGGITVVTELASSMLETVKNPNTFYATGWNPVINQIELTKEVWDYYWTSYSRGTDGRGDNVSSNVNYNNVYLNSYKQKRSKSLYDPCPYGFRIPTNEIYNMFPESYTVWKQYSYIGGVKFVSGQKSTFLVSTGRRAYSYGIIGFVGLQTFYFTSTLSGNLSSYGVDFRSNQAVIKSYSESHSYGLPLRCIEDCKKRGYQV